MTSDRWNYWVSFFFQFTYNLLWMIQTQEKINHRVPKIDNWIWRDVYEWGESFLRNDKWQIKLLSEFFFPIHIQPFTNDSNSKNNHRVWKFTSGYEGMCMSGESFLRNDKWQIKYRVNFFPIHIQSFTKDSNSINNNS